MKKNTDDTYIDIPETYSRRKLNAMYREIPLKDTTSRLLRKYFNAMARPCLKNRYCTNDKEV